MSPVLIAVALQGNAEKWQSSERGSKGILKFSRLADGSQIWKEIIRKGEPYHFVEFRKAASKGGQTMVQKLAMVTEKLSFP